MAVFTFIQAGLTDRFMNQTSPDYWKGVAPNRDGFYMGNSLTTGISYSVDNFRLNSQGTISGGTLMEILQTKRGNPVMFVDDLDLSMRVLAGYMAKDQESKIVSFLLKGDDTITLSKYADDFSGGRGSDTLYGMKGNDRISGDSGNDYLYGGSGRDTFVFETGDDKDRVMDWKDEDRVDLSGLGSIKNMKDLRDNHMRQYNDHVVIDGGHGDKLVIEDTKMSSLHADDFIF
jgi:Ca2+-binding RTX toxin-like protein